MSNGRSRVCAPWSLLISRLCVCVLAVSDRAVLEEFVYWIQVDGEHLEGRNCVHSYLCLQALADGTLYNWRPKDVCWITVWFVIRTRPWWLSGKMPACNARAAGSISGSGRSPEEGNGCPLLYSCLENPHGQRSLEGYSPRGDKGLDTTLPLNHHYHHQTLLSEVGQAEKHNCVISLIYGI